MPTIACTAHLRSKSRLAVADSTVAVAVVLPLAARLLAAPHPLTRAAEAAREDRLTVVRVVAVLLMSLGGHNVYLRDC